LKLAGFFSERENLVGNLIVGFFVIGLFNKLLLKFHKLLINSIRGDCSRRLVVSYLTLSHWREGDDLSGEILKKFKTPLTSF